MVKHKLLKTVILSAFVILLFTCNSCFAQDSIHTKLSFGIESELMCFINKGYHGSIWVGKNGLRARFVIAKATYPDYLNPQGFTKLTSNFYEMEIDYFLGKHRKEFRGLWYALGSGYTRQQIESKATHLKGTIDVLDLHSGIGYALRIYKRIYINPWAGIDLHLNAPKEVPVGFEIWKPGKIDPVFGAKIGYSF